MPGLAVLDSSPNAVVGVDADGRIVYANPRVEETFGWAPSELIGHPVELLIPERLGERHMAHRSGFVAVPAARPMGIGLDLAGRRRDGSEFPVEISLAPVPQPEGLTVYATVVDISTRKMLESQLIQAQKMESVGRLAGGIAHDFNNMLFAIRGHADLLLEDMEGRDSVSTEQVRDGVRAIGDAAERATSLTAQLLSFSRQQRVSTQVLDLNEQLGAMEPMLRRLIGEDVVLRFVLHPGAGRLRADPSQLDQVLVNLVVNARDALPATGGRVTIETARVVFDELYAMEHFEVTPGEYLMLAVSDNGSGMDARTREHIFEPFFTTKELGKGTGLGLATTYGIVRQAGGHIWLYSEPGHGTTFKLYFPSVDAAVEPAPPPAAAGAAHASGTVLVVEDEAIVRDLTTQVLQRAGYRVVTAATAEEALQVVDEHGAEIDALVTDVVMPGMSGPLLADRVRERFGSIGIVLLSGYTAETLDLSTALERGARFLGKPFRRSDLTEAVAAVSARSRTDRRDRA